MVVTPFRMKKIYTLAVIALFAVPLVVPDVSAAQANCTITRNLQVGSKGAEVTKLQQFLKSKGYFKATMVPNYGAATKAAVKSFQKAYGILQTGTVGPLTRAKIKALCTSATGSQSGSPISVTPTDAATTFEITGWIPYWRQATGTADTLPNLNKLTEVNPFVYSLKSDGTLLDNAPVTAEPWLTFNAAAKAQGVRVVPTIMTSNASLVHQLLSNAQSRATLVENIVAEVNARGFDGVDIDFEGKKAETKDFFSLFLGELKQKLGPKWLMCTIETRIPNEDKYFGVQVPADANVFANDLSQINKYCDRVRIMTYDQQGIDLKLASEAGTRLYAPNGDPAWIEKVVNLMSKDIDRRKIMIGVATYGYEYSVTTYENGQHLYDVLWTFNPGYAAPQRGVSEPSLSEKYHITPERTYWGELGFTYMPTDQQVTPPVSTERVSALATSNIAMQYANQYKSHLSYRYVVWPDEETIRQKIELAKRLGVRGIAIFKFDGGQDPDIWNVLAGVKQ